MSRARRCMAKPRPCFAGRGRHVVRSHRTARCAVDGGPRRRLQAMARGGGAALVGALSQSLGPAAGGVIKGLHSPDTQDVECESMIEEDGAGVHHPTISPEACPALVLNAD